MDELVMIRQEGSRSEVYTTAACVADYAEVDRKTVNRLIQQHEQDLEEFGVLRFEIAKPPRGSTGGRPEKLYLLNEQQATLLITYLKNTPPVRAFKKALVREFFKARQELIARKTARSEGKPIRRAMTDAIRDSGENIRMKGHAYSAYENLVYSCSLGVNARKLRQQRGGYGCAVDLLSSQELERVINAENQVTVLLDMGFQYDRIRELMNNRTKGAV